MTTDLADEKPIVADKDDENESFLSEMRDRFQRASDYDRDLRQKALDDIKFTYVPGNQWDTYMRAVRADRPCYEFNRVRQSVKQVLGDQLQNRPSIKIRAVEEGDVDTAEIYEGLIRNIEAVSRAENAYDNAAAFSVPGGYGVWRILTDYASDDDFDQDIFIKPVANPFSAYCDPDAREVDRRDAKFWFLSDHMERKAFEAKYPDATTDDYFGDSVPESLLPWVDDERVRICEYWYKKPETVTILKLSDGSVVDQDDYDKDAEGFAKNGITIERSKEITRECVYMDIVCGGQRLEGPYKWAGKYIPIVPVYGEMLNIDGRDEWCGMVRYAKDSQRLFNFEQSTMVELVAKQPQQPLTAPAESIKGYENFYENLTDKDVPVLPYNVVPNAPDGGRPGRVAGAQFPIAWANLAESAAENIKATLGIFDASLGAPSNETSGRAIVARQREGDTANFVYIDNINKAIKFTGEILVDLIPKIYDTARVMRILGKDGAEKWVQINHGVQDPQTGEYVVLNDLTRGKYEVAVDTGPSYTTQRQELADAAMQLAKSPGPAGLVWQLAFMESSDLPNAEKYVQAFRQFLVNQGLMEPQEGDQPRPPPQPNPKDMADAQLKQSQAELSQAKTQEIVQSLPSNIAKTKADAQENASKAVRNVQDAHHAEVNHILEHLVTPPLDMWSNTPTPGADGGTYQGF